MSDDFFKDGDPFKDPHWQKVKPKRSSRHIGCPTPWFTWLFDRVGDQGKNQLGVALYLYRRCCICNNDTVTVPNGEIEELLNISRWAKCRALRGLELAEVIRRIGRDGWRHATKIQLCHWPHPPSQ